jgi:hypothetical protein
MDPIFIPGLNDFLPGKTPGLSDRGRFTKLGEDVEEVISRIPVGLMRVSVFIDDEARPEFGRVVVAVRTTFMFVEAAEFTVGLMVGLEFATGVVVLFAMVGPNVNRQAVYEIATNKI